MAEASIEDYHNMLSDEESLEQSYIREERKIVIHRALKKLKSEYRQALYLTCFEGFDNTQAATAMKKSSRQIENLVYRAKMSLKSELDKEGFHSRGRYNPRSDTEPRGFAGQAHGQ